MRVFTLPHFLKPYNQRCRVFAAAQRRGPWWNNAVVFFPPALRRRTRTRCSWKGTTDLFFLHRQKAVIEGAKAYVCQWPDELPIRVLDMNVAADSGKVRMWCV